MPLQNSGTCKYAGVAFTQLYRSKTSGSPHYDEANRTVTWVDWMLEVDGVIAGDATKLDDTTNVPLTTMRNNLLRPGQELDYRSKGFGDLWVNGASPVQDVAWGPHPKILSWVPVGNDLAALVTFQVIVHIPQCPQAVRYYGLAAFNYEVSIELDDDGYATRTISGYLVIAQTRQRGTNLVQDNAEAYYPKVIPDVPEGFYRTARPRKLSKDKNRLDFSFTDKQIPAPLPDNTTKCNFKHTVRSQLMNTGRLSPKGFTVWEERLNGSITLPPNRPKGEAMQVFLQVLSSRMRPRAAGKDGFPPPVGKDVYLLTLSLGEEVFGRGSEFEASWIRMRTSIVDIIGKSNLWQPIAGTSFVTMKKSLLASAWSPLGPAGMTVPTNSEVLVDLCEPPETKVPAPAKLKPELKPRPVPKPQPDRPDPESSWCDYDNNLRIITINRVSRRKRLPQNPPPQQLPFFVPDPTAPSDTFSGPAPPPDSISRRIASQTRGEASGTPEPPVPQPDVVQQGGTPEYYVLMWGHAYRIGYPIPVPRLVSVNGVKVVQLQADTDSGRVGGLPGMSLNWASWAILYILPKGFQGPVPQLRNPIYDG